MAENTSDVVLSVKDLHVYFYTNQRCNKVLRGVSFDIRRGRTLCVVGESGCGKTTLGKSILQLVPVTEGSMEYRFEEGCKPGFQIYGGCDELGSSNIALGADGIIGSFYNVIPDLYLKIWRAVKDSDIPAGYARRPFSNFTPEQERELLRRLAGHRRPGQHRPGYREKIRERQPGL